MIVSPTRGREADPQSLSMAGRRFRALVAAILLAHAGLLAWGASRLSPATDEVGHLVAGLSHWYLGKFDLYRVNPPLVRLLASAPVALARPATDWSEYRLTARPEWYVGNDFIAANGERAFWLFTVARWVCIPLSLLGGYTCFRWAADLYGPTPGLVALLLWCICPNILAHAQLITPDVGGSALGVTAAYAFWKWLRLPCTTRALAAGFTLGLAELCKSTWIILFVLWPALWWASSGVGRRASNPIGRLRQAIQLALILGLALYMINLGFGFEGSFRRLGDFEFFSNALAGRAQDGAQSADPATGNRFRGTPLAHMPVPVPANYLLGIDFQKYEFDRKIDSYLCGVWKLGGWWYYYLYAMAIKVPLGTWTLLVLAAALGVGSRAYRSGWHDELVVLSHASVVIALVSSQTGFNHHLRYVLPAFPFLFIAASRVGIAGTPARRWVGPMVVVALIWAAASSLRVYPHNLSYFNELVGGPTGGHAHLLNSNIDWGLDLFEFRRWVAAHPEARPLSFANSSLLDLRSIGLDLPRPPRGPSAGEDLARAQSSRLGPLPGWYAVSVDELRGRDGAYLYFLRFRPVAMAGYSIYIYHITRSEAENVRAELGLGKLAPGAY
jgi:hypothetical protein